MMLRLVLALSLALALPACGTKSPLLTPDGKRTAKGQADPSEPSIPIAR